MQNTQPTLDPTTILILKKLADIEKSLEKKVAYLPAEDAVDMFWEYLQTKKAPRGYRYPLDLFKQYFQGRNIAEITAEEVERFMYAYWGDKSPTTIRVRYKQLDGLFKYAILVLQRKGSPVFSNPMMFITTPEPDLDTPDWYPPETIRGIIASATQWNHWIILSALATTGMRVGELIKLTPADIDYDVVKIREPKSGRKEEHIVLPGLVASELQEFIKDHRIPDDGRIFPRYTTIHKIVARAGRQNGVDFSPHKFRKWVATYWDRQGDYLMADCILRHKSSNGKTSTSGALRRTYIAPLSVDEMRVRQREVERILLR